jgi:hypothetical protein
MAELFGIIAGAASLAALFVPCVDCFEYIQLGRHFSQDYETYQVKLDVVWLRLSRWGLAFGLGENPNPNSQPIQPQVVATERELDTLTKVLTRLLQDLLDAKKRSDEYDSDEEGGASSMEVCDPNTHLKGRFKVLHNTITKIVANRKQEGVSLRQKTKWALYEKKVFDRLIEDISSHMDTLEKVFPTERKALINKALVSTSKAEVLDFSNEELKLLAFIAGTSDKMLVEAVESTLVAKGDTWRNFDISGEDASFRVHIGHDIKSGEKYGGSVFDTFIIRGKGSSHVGHNLGYNGDPSSSHMK